MAQTPNTPQVTSVPFDSCICKSMNHNPETKPYARCWSKTHDAYWAAVNASENASIAKAERAQS